ncbi:ArsR/SmtB family transcription factor [Flavobacterium caeni]|uniref:ArsR/SmtB family transcription factor n=1 Tax=Flavobacterium caeni TaxID=490189 RepID=UPI001B8A9670|nr:metalloregulator ArsR/SmtB family transcription factor [Flavobacterium caeni]
MDAKVFEKVSKALGDPYRLKIIEKIQKNGDFVPCTSILDLCGLSQSTVSHHIKQLVDANLLVAVKEGRNVKYILNKESFGNYIDFLNKFQQ